MDSKQWIEEILSQSGFGLEEENQRVTLQGRLAQSKHPFGDDPVLDRDFCESQLEMITPVHNSPQALLASLRETRKKAARQLASLNPPEFLWPFSNPPRIESEEDIRIAQFTGERAEKTVYRNYLAKKYGKRLQSLSGIHFNFSFPPALLESLQAEGRGRDQVYMELAEQVLAHAWLIVALTASSPLWDPSFDSVSEALASYRCSEKGYWNDFDPILDFSSIPAYLDSIQSYVDAGRLYSAAELYYPVRLKPRGSNETETLRAGVNHIELRMLDINPLFEEGIAAFDIQFLTLLLLYLTQKGRRTLSDTEQIQALVNMKAAAHRPLEETHIHWLDGREYALKELGLKILEDMERILGTQEVIAMQREKLQNPRARYANQICERFGDDYMGEGLRLAKAFAQKE